jgi:type I restriction enzyme R subunit
VSNFAFLLPEWTALHESAARTEQFANADARTACFYARRTLELAVAWLYKNDPALHLPYQDQLSALIYEPTFRQTVGDAVFNKARVIKDLGNLAAHSQRPIRQFDALTATKELFHICYWLARTYSRGTKPSPALTFNPALIPKPTPAPLPQSVDALKRLEEQLHERDEKLSVLLSDKATLDAELTRLREEIAAVKRANTQQADAHDYSEAETRDYFIDLLLKEAGWALDRTEDREYPVTGMPTKDGQNNGPGFVDYVLWGSDGKPVGLVEAKRTKKDPRIGQQQAKLYADCLERQFGQRPVIFYSNGYDHWLWDDAMYPPRAVQGFYTRNELELLIQRRPTRKPLAETPINAGIVERYYQTRAIRRISETFERDHQRKALVVMATGAGKTRTVIALCDLLMRCNWAKRVLFLADRLALVKQAVNAFKAHLPDSSPVNLVTERDEEGRVYVCTYPTMMGLIDEAHNGRRRFGIGHFDLVIIDEAHRSVYQKYRAIFEYFDSLLVGLTATPKDEIDRNTYGLFDLERGVPTDAYDLDHAVRDGFLVPAEAVSVPLHFQREGITYADLSDDEKEQWDALEWDDQGNVPPRVEPEAVNRWLFNKDTVDKVLEHLMTRGQTVAGGDRLGKTIIFAKNSDHAQFIAERFDANYPEYKGDFARVITYQTTYAQSLIDAFANPSKMPHIAISVDMLDTGIDIPEIVNLVFFKLVRSKTKFWQMLGRGTRLSSNLFGSGDHKKFFYVFDYCGNLEFFSQQFPSTDGAVGDSLTTRLFKRRLELITAIDHFGAADALTSDTVHSASLVRETPPAYGETIQGVRDDTVGLLRSHVASMNIDNFVVRPKRRFVERYAKEDAWKTLGPEQVAELVHEIAPLPSEQTDPDEDAKRFDLLMLNLELTVLKVGSAFGRLKEQVQGIAARLLEKTSIPMVRDEMVLIESVAGDEWWQDVTLPMLENARKRLRALVKLIDKADRRIVYTDFEDQMGNEVAVTLPEFQPAADRARFLTKARRFLKEHENHITIHRLRLNQPLTASDLAELERMMITAGVGTADDIARAKDESHGLGIFIRSLVGLEREAAKQAFGQFLSGGTTSANQIEFVNMIVDYLTEHGVMEAARLYESPFTDLSPRGPEGVFSTSQVDELIAVLASIRVRAAA